MKHVQFWHNAMFSGVTLLSIMLKFSSITYLSQPAAGIHLKSNFHRALKIIKGPIILFAYCLLQPRNIFNI